jgi:VWFA-related protein
MKEPASIRMHMTPRLACPVVFVLLAGFGVLAQQRPSPQGADPQPPVTFKVEVNFVEIDAVVTDADGHFVGGLTKEAFLVLEEGRPQQISAFTMVDMPVERPDPPLFKEASVEPDVHSNKDEFEGRVFVMVLDDVQTDVRRTHRVRAAARQFIERYLGAGDMVAIVQTGGGDRGSQDFTSSRARLLAAVDSFMGQKLRSATAARLEDYYIQRALGSGLAPKDTEEFQRAYKARSSLTVLKNLADYLAGIRGRRKAIIWIGEGIDFDTTDFMEVRDGDQVHAALRDAIAAASRSNVSIYSVDPRGLASGDEDAMDLSGVPDDPTLGLGTPSLVAEMMRAHQSMRAISEETGGIAFLNRNDTDSAFERIVQESSRYYILGYYAPDGRRDGRYRRIDVRVTQPGLRVRARRGYIAPRDARTPKATAVTGVSISQQFREALESPLPVSGIGFSVTSLPFQGRRPNASVAVIVELDPRGVKFVERDGLFVADLDILVRAFDAKTGKARDPKSQTANLRLQPQTLATVLRDGMRLTQRIELPPGRYRLQVGVAEKGGAAVGTIVHDLDVPDLHRSPLQMSGIALTSVESMKTPNVNSDPAFHDVMPAPPTTLREFDRTDALATFVEVYDNQTNVPHRVAIKTSVRADDGRVVFSTESERRSEELSQGLAPGSRPATGGYGEGAQIPLQDFAPGRYVLRVEARTLLAGGAAAARELEFRVR